MRGLLAIEPLYHQIVAGNKTQTRRSGGLEVINENPDEYSLFNGGVYLLSPEMAYENIKSYFDGEKPKYGTPIAFLLFIGNGHGMCNPIEVKPRYKVGEVLYLKEPVTLMRITSPADKAGDYYMYAYGADPKVRAINSYKNKLFMPASAARAFIQITGIRCERLMDISDADCIAEGISETVMIINEAGETVQGYKNYLPERIKVKNKKVYEINAAKSAETPKESFLSLYKFANKVNTVPNIWVWVYQFTYLKDYKITT